MGRCAPTSGGRSRRPLPLVGLLLALPFRGHDLPMAGDAHAAPSPAPPDRHHVAHPARTDSPGTASETTPVPDHPAHCAVVRPAAPRTGGAPDPIPSAAPGDQTGAPSPPLAAPGARGRAEPTAAPGTRRALFQVYRI